MKRTVYVLAFIPLISMVFFSKANVTPSLEPIISIRNGGEKTLSPFAIVRLIYTEGSKEIALCQDETIEMGPLLPGHEITALVHFETAPEISLISIDVVTIGSEAYQRELSHEERQNRIFTISETEVFLGRPEIIESITEYVPEVSSEA